jgi:hypothetical protein
MSGFLLLSGVVAMTPIDPAHMLFLGFWDLIEVSCEDYWVGLGS